MWLVLQIMGPLGIIHYGTEDLGASKWDPNSANYPCTSQGGGMY